MPKNTRLLSSLQSSVARSLTTQPVGNPAAFAGSSVTGAGSALAERGLHVGERDEHVVALAHLLDVGALEHRERRAVVAPREAVVDLRVVVERVDAAVPQIEHEQAVAVLDRGVDGVGEQIAGLVERDVADAAEQLIAAGREVVDVTSTPRGPAGAASAPARSRRRRPPARRRCRHRRRCPPRPAPPAFAGRRRRTRYVEFAENVNDWMSCHD